MAPRIILMTGSSSGIGLSLAKLLSQNPENIVIATVIALSEKDDLVAAVGDALDKTVFIKKLDITNDDDITQVVKEVLDSYGRIDVLFNIAGVFFCRAPEDITRKEMDLVLGVNLIGTIRLTQAVLPNMKERKEGRIISIASFMGKLGWPYMDVYVASKHGVEGYFESVAASVKAFNIKVCIVEPGVIKTPMFHFFGKDTKAYLARGTSTDIDRRQVTSMLKTALTLFDQLQPEDVAEAMVTKCLEPDEPDLRMQVFDDRMMADMVKAVPDLTGNEAVQLWQKFFSLA